MLGGGGARALPLQDLPGGMASTAAEPALSMCRRVLCSSTEHDRHRGQEKTPEVAGRKERGLLGSGGSKLPFFSSPAFVCVFKPPPLKISPRGINPQTSAAGNCSCSPFSKDLLLLQIKQKIMKKANKTVSLI